MREFQKASLPLIQLRFQALILGNDVFVFLYTGLNYMLFTSGELVARKLSDLDLCVRALIVLCYEDLPFILTRFESQTQGFARLQACFQTAWSPSGTVYF